MHAWMQVIAYLPAYLPTYIHSTDLGPYTGLDLDERNSRGDNVEREYEHRAYRYT